MYPELIFLVIVFLVLFNFTSDQILDWLNLRARSPRLPQELSAYYDKDNYQKSYSYHKENYQFSLISGLFNLTLILAMLLLDGFAILNNFTSSLSSNPSIQTLLFFGILMIASDLLALPFSLYGIFKIEEKYGFNKMTLGTFFTDKLKSYLLGGILGGSILYALSWFYLESGSMFWIWALAIIIPLMLFMTAFYTSLILPIFNKLTPLEQGELRDAIEKYAQKGGL
jgi:STE24 endopeptidase